MVQSPTEPASPEILRPKQRFFDGGFYFLLFLAVAGGLACYFIKGDAVFFHAIEDQLWLMLALVPVIAGAVVLAAFLQVLCPPEFIRRRLGDSAGFTGILTATFIGALIPGGPMISLPLLVAVMSAGASRAAGVAFVSSWTLLAVPRVIQWDLPLLGAEFTGIRMAASVALPVLAALLSIPLFRYFFPPDDRKPD